MRLLLNGGLTTGNSKQHYPDISGNIRAKRALRSLSTFRQGILDNFPLPEMSKSDEVNQILLWWDSVRQRHKDNLPPSRPEVFQALKNIESNIENYQSIASRYLVLGEILHIVRPLIYVSALRKWGVRSWKPWLISLGFELGSLKATYYGNTSSRLSAQRIAQSPCVKSSMLSHLYAVQHMTWNPEELDELTRRKLLFLISMLRDPFFGSVTRPILEKWLYAVERIPIASWLSAKLAELLFGIQKYYSYTSAS